jgi:S1-C subfamily serine protease
MKDRLDSTLAPLPRRWPRHRRGFSIVVSVLLAIGASSVWTAGAAPPAAQAPPAPRPRSDRTVDSLSVVRLRSTVPGEARSSRTLGRHREGTGVVIDSQGLVLTIGYLILEAATVELSTADGTAFPATVVAYDGVTGLGLLRATGALPIAPIKIGESASVAARDRVLIVGFDGVAPAVVVSRRPFVGYWEYLLDDAIYTAPPTVNWSGAALIDSAGTLLGIGSLAVNDADPGRNIAGHMFVPIDLLKPVLKDLVKQGKSSAPPRPWIGVHTQELQGNVVVMRVNPDSPADAALRPGDVIIALGNDRVTGQAEFYTRLWSLGAAGVEVPLRVLREGKIQSVTVKSTDRDRYYRVRPTF